LIENEVTATYAALLGKFGRTTSLTTPMLRVDAAGADSGSAQSDVQGDQTITVLPEGTRPYPAADEISALQRKVIPPALRYFYVVGCEDGYAASSTKT